MVPFGGFWSKYSTEVDRYPATSSKTRDSLGKTAKCCMYLLTSQQRLSLYKISCMTGVQADNLEDRRNSLGFWIVTVMESFLTYESG